MNKWMYPNWNNKGLFPESVAPFYIAWANDHFYPMILWRIDDVDRANFTKQGPKIIDLSSNSSLQNNALVVVNNTDRNDIEVDSNNIELDRNDIDVDKTNFLMLTKDLLKFVGFITRPANRKVKVHDLDEFKYWLHVIFDPVVVKVYAGDTPNDKIDFKNSVVYYLRHFHGLILTSNEDSLTLSTNQVNILVQAITKVLYDLGAKECKVLTFGMKWKIPMAEPKIDHFINQYFTTVV
jgi:hypothetical protein